MEDTHQLAAMLPTAGYLFAEELDAHFLALDDFHSMLLQDDCTKVAVLDSPFGLDCSTPTVAPTSPSSVVFLPPFYPPLESFDDDITFTKHQGVPSTVQIEKGISKQHLEHAGINPRPFTCELQGDSVSDDDKERLRQRQRGYEKRYRGRKKRDLKVQRDAWLALEMKLDADRKQHCKPYVRIERKGSQDSLRYKLLLLKLEEHALRQDHVAMRSLQAWEEISRIREYSDKEQLRSMSEWRHSADKVIGRCAVLGSEYFHPYAPMIQRHFTW